MKRKNVENLMVVVLIIGIISLLWEWLKPSILRLDRQIFPKDKFENKIYYNLRWYIVVFMTYGAYATYQYFF